jgi:hypothetical protein
MSFCGHKFGGLEMNRKIIVGCALGGCIAITAGVFYWSNRKNNETKNSASISISPKTEVGSEERPINARLDNPTIADMTKKGLPIPSSPRKSMIEQTAKQDVPDLVKDLGNPFTIAFSMFAVGGGMGSYQNLRTWDRLTYSVKSLRLVEEAKKDPATVRPLVIAELRRSLASLDEMYSNAKFNMLKLASGMEVKHQSEDDPYYLKHRAYEEPIAEMTRRLDSIHACFYVLANIGALHEANKELKAFIQADLGTFKCDDLNVWFVELYYAEISSPNAAGYETHRKIISKPMARNLVNRSRWNSVIDIHDTLAGAAKVNMAGVETIEVLEIPKQINLTEKQKIAVLDNFAGKKAN